MRALARCATKMRPKGKAEQATLEDSESTGPDDGRQPEGARRHPLSSAASLRWARMFTSGYPLL